MFERDIYNQLQKWAERTGRKPLVLRGARQVGKTTLVNEFARNFENYLHLNLEREEDARLFQSTDKVQEIMKIACFQKNILLREGRTLLFIDEIQNVDNGRLVMVDPIMADGGKLYNGIGMERVAAMRKLVSYSDVMVPNMTEAGFLTGICPGRERASAAELRELVDGLHKLSGKSVVITSAQDSETDEHLVCGYDHKS